MYRRNKFESRKTKHDKRIGCRCLRTDPPPPPHGKEPPSVYFFFINRLLMINYDLNNTLNPKKKIHFIKIIPIYTRNTNTCVNRYDLLYNVCIMFKVVLSMLYDDL